MNIRDLAQNPQGIGLSPAALQAARIIEAARAKLDLTYFSKVRFTATLNAGGTAYDVTTDEVRFFSYGKRQTMESAGFGSGFVATPADTNLAKGGETNNQAKVLVRAMSITPVAGSPSLIKALRSDVSTKMELGSSNGAGWDLGPLGVQPGGASLFGSEAEGIAGGDVSSVAAGNPYSTNVRSFGKRPFRWSPVGSDNSAATILNVVCKVERSISVPILNTDETFVPPDEITADFLAQLYIELDQPLDPNS